MMRSSTRPRNFFRKLVVNGVNNSKTAIQNDCLMRLYDADSELKAISSELDSFDGKKDPVRCNLLVNQLRTAQDKVISLLFQLMDDCNCERASRDYRMKFPDEILLSEGSESLNGQIWFGAECLSAGSNILNHNKESTMLRPMAKTLTQHLDSLRNDLRDLVIDGAGAVRINETLIKKMVAFDHIFATFEYEYVRTMLPIRTVAEIEKLQEVAVLFSETLIDCLKRGLIKQDDIDEFQPIVMIAIPRLAIVRGLLYKNENPIYTRHKSQMCSLFQPFHGPLHSIRKLLRGLRPSELYTLERMLANDQSTGDENFKDKNDDDKTIVSIENQASNDSHSSPQDEQYEAGTSGANYTNVLMDGLQYPVGHKRSSLDGSSADQEFLCPSQHYQEDYNCYLEVQASSSKANNDACSSLENNGPIPSPSTSIPSPTQRKTIDSQCADESKCASDEHSQRNGTNCDTENCCLSPPESDAQLEKLIANFSPTIQDEPESTFEVNIHETNRSGIVATQTHEKTTQIEPNNADIVKETSPVKTNNEAEIDELFQKQAQQLLHRLFVAISGVADQLQSNFASDLRFILRHIFSSELAGEDSDGDNDDIQDDNAYDEMYEEEEEEEAEGEYSNEQSDSSLPIEQGIEARETNLIDLESGYTLMDTIDRAGLFPDPPAGSTISPEHNYPFNSQINNLEQNYQQPPPPPHASQQHMHIEGSLNSLSPSSQHQVTTHYHHPTRDSQRNLHDTLNHQHMNQELLAEMMRATNQQNLIYTNQDSPNEPSIMDSQQHQRLIQQQLQSVSRATNRIAAAAAAASAATTPGYGHNMVDNNNPSSGGYNHQINSNHRLNHSGERRSRHHGSSRSRRSRGPPVWVRDQDAPQCGSCNAQFTLFRRRHHCRACGHIFCAECSKFTKNLNCWGYNGPVRVCEPCYNRDIP